VPSNLLPIAALTQRIGVMDNRTQNCWQLIASLTVSLLELNPTNSDKT